MKTKIVGLIHFDEPIGPEGGHQAQHYLFSAGDLDRELAVHRKVTSHAAIMREVNRLGIGWRLVRTWPGDRREERRLKGIKDAAGMCPACGAWPRKGADGMRGGYTVIAAAINERYAPEHPVTRQQVYNWDQRQYRNMKGELPPAPAEIRSHARRTTPTRVFETEPWLEWYGGGTRGRDRRGWVVHVPVTRPVATVRSDLVS